MPTDETIPDPIQRVVRGEHIAPVELDDMLPGSNGGLILPGAYRTKESIANDLNDAENSVADIERNIKYSIAEPIAAAGNVVEGIKANILGRINNELDAADKLQTKLKGKVSNSIATKLIGAYSDLARIGIPTPTIEQVRYGNATGDYLGSMIPDNEVMAELPRFATNIGEGSEVIPIAEPVGDDETGSGEGVGYPLPPDAPSTTTPPSTPSTPAPLPAAAFNQCLERIKQIRGTVHLHISGSDMSGVFANYVTLTKTADYEWQGTAIAHSTNHAGTRQTYYWRWNGSTMLLVTAATVTGAVPDWICNITTNPLPISTSFDCSCWLYDARIDSRASGLPPLAGRCPSEGNALRILVTTVSDNAAAAWSTCQMGSPPTGEPTTTTTLPAETTPVTLPADGSCSVSEALTCGPDGTPFPEMPIRPMAAKCEPGTDPLYFRTDKLTEANEFTCTFLTEILDKGTVSTADAASLIGMKFASGDPGTIAKQVSRAIIGTSEPILPSLTKRFASWLEFMITKAIKGSGCDAVRLAFISVYHGAWKFVNHWTNAVPKAVSNTLQQAENLACQTAMPDQSSVDKAFLANEVDECIWECWTRINGNVVQAAKKGLDSLRTRPTSEQLSRLLRQGQITDLQWKQGLRSNGVLREEDAKRIFDLTQDWPSLSDLTPMIARDAFDVTTIDWTKVDKLFEDKYTPETKKYLDARGITKEVAKLYWRAHFHLPSYTMVTEMYHRFRNLDPADPLHTDIDKVKALLIQDDWHPDWVDRMLAITFRPMRLTDIKAAFNMRILDEDGLRRKLESLGYSDDDVNTTTEYWKRLREIRDAKQGGFPSVKTLISNYANCEIDDSTFRYQLSQVVETPEQELKALDAARIARESESNRRTIAGVSWQYRRGLIDEATAHSELARQGIDPSCIPSLVRLWQSRKAKQPKQLAANSLCDMMDKGILSQGEFVSALISAGWSAIDADRMVRRCAIGLTQKQMREAEREAKRIAAARKTQEREDAKRQRLAECGPAPCPANRKTANQNGAVDPSTQDQT